MPSTSAKRRVWVGKRVPGVAGGVRVETGQPGQWIGVRGQARGELGLALPAGPPGPGVPLDAVQEQPDRRGPVGGRRDRPQRKQPDRVGAEVVAEHQQRGQLAEEIGVDDRLLRRAAEQPERRRDLGRLGEGQLAPGPLAQPPPQPDEDDQLVQRARRRQPPAVVRAGEHQAQIPQAARLAVGQAALDRGGVIRRDGGASGPPTAGCHAAPGPSPEADGAADRESG